MLEDAFSIYLKYEFLLQKPASRNGVANRNIGSCKTVDDEHDGKGRQGDIG